MCRQLILLRSVCFTGKETFLKGRHTDAHFLFDLVIIDIKLGKAQQ